MNARSGAAIVFSIMLADAVTTILFNLDFSFWRVSILYKSFVEIALLVYFFPREKYRYWYLLVVFMTISYSVGISLLSLDVNGVKFFNGFASANKYLFVFVLGMVFMELRSSKRFVNEMEMLITYFFLVNSVLVILGFVFKIQLFASYPTGIIRGEVLDVARFGYKGLIGAINEATGVYFFGLAYLFRAYFRYDKKDALGVLLLTIIAAILSGSKGCWAIVLVFSVYFLYKYRRRKFLLKYVPITAMVIFVFGGAMWMYVWTRYLYYFQFFLRPGGEDWITFLMSGRTLEIQHSLEFMAKNWNFGNYIFGGSDLHLLMSETGLDGYFMFGIPFLALLFSYIRLFLEKDSTSENKFILIFFLLLAATGGHIFASAVVPPFFLIYVFTARPTKGPNSKGHQRRATRDPDPGRLGYA